MYIIQTCWYTQPFDLHDENGIGTYLVLAMYVYVCFVTLRGLISKAIILRSAQEYKFSSGAS